MLGARFYVDFPSKGTMSATGTLWVSPGGYTLWVQCQRLFGRACRHLIVLTGRRSSRKRSSAAPLRLIQIPDPSEAEPK
jgi:hypothetical protein